MIIYLIEINLCKQINKDYLIEGKHKKDQSEPAPFCGVRSDWSGYGFATFAPLRETF